MAKRKINKLFLTINVGQPAEEKTFKRYIGIAPVVVTAINPTKADLEKLYDRPITVDPEYQFETANGKFTRIEFHVKTSPTYMNNKFSTTGRVSFLASMDIDKSRDGLKVCVIDDYGETTWVTKEQFQAGERPASCKVVGKYRPCHKGEADLVAFIRAWLNVEDSTTYDVSTKSWIPKSTEELEKCKIILNWEEVCKGNLDELREYVTKYPNHALKVCFGIRTGNNNKHYTEIFNHTFLKNNSTNYGRIEKDINSAKQRGAFANTEFSTMELHEWTVRTTDFMTVDNYPQSTPTYADVPVAPVPEEQVYDGNNDLPF